MKIPLSFRVLVVMICILGNMNMWAQSLSNSTNRDVRRAAIELITDYESYADLHDRTCQEGLRELFSSSQSTIFSDLLEYQPTAQIGLEDYIAQLSARENVSIELSDMTLSRPRVENGRIYIDVSLKKSMVYTYGEVLFASKEYYGRPYQLQFKLEYDASAKTCRIRQLNGSIDTQSRLLDEHFLVIQQPKGTGKKSKSQQAQLNGNPVEYNDFGQAFAMDDDLSVKDFDAEVTKTVISSTEVFDLVSLSSRKRHWRIKPVFSITAGNAYKVETLDNTLSKSSAIESGLDLGVSGPMGRYGHMGIYTGARINRSTIDFWNESPMSFSQSVSYLDMAGNIVSGHNIHTRQYNNLSASEGVQYVDLAIPLYLGIEIYFHQYVRMMLNAGVKYYVNLHTGVKPYHLEGSVAATTGGEEIPFSKDYDSFLFPADYRQHTTLSLQNLPLSAMGDVSFDFLIWPKQSMFVCVGAGYEYGLFNAHSGSGIAILNNEFSPLVYNPIAKEDIAVRSFMEGATFKRQSVWINFGLKIKL